MLSQGTKLPLRWLQRIVYKRKVRVKTTHMLPTYMYEALRLARPRMVCIPSFLAQLVTWLAQQSKNSAHSKAAGSKRKDVIREVATG